jgi:quercetin dioxygenase-like cupin family protein
LPSTRNSRSQRPRTRVIQNRVEIGPEAPFVNHKHAGEEIIYVLERSLEYQVEGRPPTTLNAGDVLLVPAETVHAVRNVAPGTRPNLPPTSSRKASRSS